MKEENYIFGSEEVALRGEAFYFADIPECWEEGDFIAELYHADILDVLCETADYVDSGVFDGDMPGSCGAYYKVYAADVNEFKRKLSEGLISLLIKTYGEAE